MENINDYRILIRKQYEDLTLYLYILKENLCEKNQIFPSQKYVKKLLQIRDNAKNHEFFKAIMRKSEESIYLVPKPEFLEKMIPEESRPTFTSHDKEKIKLPCKFYDIRIMISDLNEIEAKYLNDLSEATRNRNLQNREMRHLVRPYHKCSIF
jgi:hypothetical protein